MKLYNSLTQTKEEFIPLNKRIVTLYVCGITPYDTTHLGHAFTYVFFDVLVRYLTFRGYKVVYVQNVTDIDDDILKKAKEENKDWKELGDFWTERFLKEMRLLNVSPPTYYVKATNSLTSMIRIIKVLIEKDFAYEKNGNVYFEVNKFKNYGKLSGFNKNQMLKLLRERGGNPNDPLKKNPLDFLLWQHFKRKEPFWESPWGKGRPGWHIECSAMANQYLDDQIDPFGKLRVNGERSRTIDIHGGGRDLIYPHHESEIAQSESFTKKAPFVKYWLHTAMVMYQGEKMAKSLGNLVMISDLLKKYSPNAIRFLLLSHHYRSPWEFNEEELKSAEKSLLIIKKALKTKLKGQKSRESDKYFKKFLTFMDDDLNTPQALMFIQSLRIDAQITVKNCLSILGFDL